MPETVPFSDTACVSQAKECPELIPRIRPQIREIASRVRNPQRWPHVHYAISRRSLAVRTDRPIRLFEQSVDLMDLDLDTVGGGVTWFVRVENQTEPI